MQSNQRPGFVAAIARKRQTPLFCTCERGSWWDLQALPDVEECGNGKQNGEDYWYHFIGSVDIQIVQSCGHVSKLSRATSEEKLTWLSRCHRGQESQDGGGCCDVFGKGKAGEDEGKMSRMDFL